MLSKFACFSIPLPEVIKKAKDLGWRKCRHIPPIQQWKGSLPKATKLKTPIEYCWDDLLTHDCIENMVEQTNLYAIQCDPHKPLNVTCQEMEQFIGICFYMSIYGLPGTHMYWNSTTSVDCVANVMPIHR